MRRRVFLQGAAASVLIGGGRAFAQSAPPALPNTPDAYRRLFDAAVEEHGFETAILVVRRGGRIVLSRGHQANPSGPSLVGSLSKPITAVAVATLIRDGKLSFATPMRDALAGYFKRYGRPADPRFENVTVEQLLVHRSGMLGNPEGDPVHRARADRARRGEGDRDMPQPILRELLTYPLTHDPGTNTSYSGGGYFALAAVIEQLTGKPYETFCREAVLAKLGVQAQLHPEWRVLGAAGGWYITGENYLRFLDVFDPANPFLGESVKAWIDAAQTRWGAANRGGWVSLAVNTSATSGRWRVGHTGSLNSRAWDARGKPIAAAIESIGYRRADGTAVFLAITPSVGGGHPGFRPLVRDIERAHAIVTVS